MAAPAVCNRQWTSHPVEIALLIEVAKIPLSLLQACLEFTTGAQPSFVSGRRSGAHAKVAVDHAWLRKSANANPRLLQRVRVCFSLIAQGIKLRRTDHGGRDTLEICCSQGRCARVSSIPFVRNVLARKKPHGR